MDIKEVLNLPTGTEVKAGNVLFAVINVRGIKGLHKKGNIPDCVYLTSDFVNAEYELVRKKLNFFEAMRLVDEGKIVESNFSEYIFKKAIDGAVVCKKKEGEGKFDTNDICADEIADDWYEVTE